MLVIGRASALTKGGQPEVNRYEDFSCITPGNIVLIPPENCPAPH